MIASGRCEVVEGNVSALKFESIIDEMKTYTAEDIESALRSAGFSQIHTEHHPSHSWLVIISRK